MTGYTVHTGSTKSFSEGWDRIFKSKGTRGSKAGATKSGKRTSGAKRKK
jgi:hypothetical protein